MRWWPVSATAMQAPLGVVRDLARESAARCAAAAAGGSTGNGPAHERPLGGVRVEISVAIACAR